MLHSQENDELELYGKFKAKVKYNNYGYKQGKLILVTAINPTPLGEGKTTMSIGLADGLRKIGDDYCVAMGTYYSSTIGERFKITMSTGATFTVIISDIKSNRHTDSTHRYTARNGCMMEFLIDKNCLANCIRVSGNVGSLSLFSGQFAKVEKIS